MKISRRGFVGGVIASATMAQADAISEILSWLRRKPVSFVPPAAGWPAAARAVRVFLARHPGDTWREIAGVTSVDLTMRRREYDEITVKGEGLSEFTDTDLRDIERFRVLSPDGYEVSGVLGVQEVTLQVGARGEFSFRGVAIDPHIYDFMSPKVPTRLPAPLRSSRLPTPLRSSRR